MTDPVSEQNSPSRQAGRPEYKPTDEARGQVRELRAAGKTKGEIAAAIGVSRNTLRKHFAAELAEEPSGDQQEQQLDFGGEAHKVATVVAPEPGRPEFEPTQRQRDDVCNWAADDWSEDRMARLLGVSRNTLRKHFAKELEFGADKVRTETLRDLRRGSAAGKVAASAKLLELTGLVAPPLPQAAPKAEEPEEEQLGKKAQAKVDAQTAEQGTGWAELVH